MNETLRLVFAALLGFALLMLYKNYTEWEAAQLRAAAEARVAAGQEARAVGAGGGVGAIAADEGAGGVAEAGDGEVPVLTQRLGSGGAALPAAREGGGGGAAAWGRRVTVQTDWLTAVIAEEGGNLVEVRLKKHLQDEAPLRLIEDGERRYVAQSGVIGVRGAPNHNSRFALVGDETEVTAAGGAVTVALTAVAEGVRLRKTYVFGRADYVISVALQAENAGTAPVELNGYFQLAHDGSLPRNYSSLLPTFFGAAMYTRDSKFVKIGFEDIGEDPYPRKSDNGWIGVIQRYFAAVWMPPVGAGEREFFMRRADGGGARLGVILPIGRLAGGETGTATARLFAGAQEQTILQELHESGDAPGISLVVDYGWLTFIAVLLFELLSWIQGFVANWGVSIILLTLSVKLLFYPLSSAAYRSMAKMKEEAPRIKQMQEKYGSDKQRLQKEMMALYREKKINPVGGCLPILVQIPVFIALYWVLLGSVELRQAPFVGWIGDLSAPDPFFILPLVMGVAMFAQTKLSPEPPDPTQAMIMKVMPIGFAVFSVFFPAGLVLYWAVNTILSIAQQWYIARQMAVRAKKA